MLTHSDDTYEWMVVLSEGEFTPYANWSVAGCVGPFTIYIRRKAK